MISHIVKSCAYNLLEIMGGNAFSRFMLSDRLLVLCYHSVVSDETPNDPRTRIAVTRSQFESQLQELTQHWSPLSVQNVLSACYVGSQLPSNAVLITFDDGFRNNLTLAAPLLKRYGFPAVFFVTTGHIGTGNLLWMQELVERVFAWPDTSLPIPIPKNGLNLLPAAHQQPYLLASLVVADCKRLANEERISYLRRLGIHDLPPMTAWQHELYDFMSWDEVHELSAQGFHIGAHTVDHPILSTLPDSEMKRQLAQSKQTVEVEIGQECPCIAFPNGGKNDYTETTLETASRCGYRLGFTLRGTRNAPSINPMEVDRICVTRDTTIGLFRAKLAGLR